MVGLGLTFLAAGLVAFGHLRWAGVVLIFAGTCDILDGALARSTHASYPYGAFLDSTLDRYSEGAVYLGLAAYFVTVGGPLQEWLVLATLAALAGSFLVSYVRARAQSLATDVVETRAIVIVQTNVLGQEHLGHAHHHAQRCRQVVRELAKRRGCLGRLLAGNRELLAQLRFGVAGIE